VGQVYEIQSIFKTKNTVLARSGFEQGFLYINVSIRSIVSVLAAFDLRTDGYESDAPSQVTLSNPPRAARSIALRPISIGFLIYLPAMSSTRGVFKLNAAELSLIRSAQNVEQQHLMHTNIACSSSGYDLVELAYMLPSPRLSSHSYQSCTRPHQGRTCWYRPKTPYQPPK
jgi:hypothetical protein